MTPWAEGKAAARAFRARLRLAPEDPIDDVFRIIDDLGIDTTYRDFGSENADGVYLRGFGGTLIVINTARPAIRQRFTAAHELGHHTLHGNALPELTITDSDVYRNKEPREQAANAFAAYLLLPDAGVRHEVGRDPVNAETVARIAAKFGVAWRTAVYRMHNAGVFQAPMRDQLCAIPEFRQNQLIRAAGGFSIVPPPFEWPARFVDRALQLYRDGFLTEQRTATMLHITVEELLALVGRDPTNEPRVFESEAAKALLAEIT
jgi:Zn-dependent peptidase ImmA (M78 family)